MTKLNVFSTTCKTLLYTAEKSYRYVELGTLLKVYENWVQLCNEYWK